MNARVAAIICLIMCGVVVVAGIMIDAMPTVYISKEKDPRCPDKTAAEWGVFKKCRCGDCSHEFGVSGILSENTDGLNTAEIGESTSKDEGCDARTHMERALQACAILTPGFAAIAGIMNLVCICRPIVCLYCWREVFQILGLFMCIICVALVLALYFSKMCGDLQISKGSDLGMGFFLMCGQFVILLVACCVLPCGGDGADETAPKGKPPAKGKNDDVEMKSTGGHSKSGQAYQKMDNKKPDPAPGRTNTGPQNQMAKKDSMAMQKKDSMAMQKKDSMAAKPGQSGLDKKPSMAAKPKAHD